MSADVDTDDAVTDDESSVDEPARDEPADAGRHGRPSIGPLIALGLAAAVLVVALLVAIVGGDDVSATAVRVNTFEVSQKTFNSQLRELAPILRDQGASASESTDAFVPTSSAAQLAQVYVYTELLRDRVKVTDADRQSAISALGKQLSKFAPDLRDRLVDLQAMQTKLVDDRGQEGALRYLGQVSRNADIHVDPRYGFWNRLSGQVCPPTGCGSASASSGG